MTQKIRLGLKFRLSSFFIFNLARQSVCTKRCPRKLVGVKYWISRIAVQFAKFKIPVTDKISLLDLEICTKQQHSHSIGVIVKPSFQSPLIKTNFDWFYDTSKGLAIKFLMFFFFVSIAVTDTKKVKQLFSNLVDFFLSINEFWWFYRWSWWILAFSSQYVFCLDI